MMLHATTDLVIRVALHRKCRRQAKLQPDTLFIDELGLAHARSRIDVAVINGCIHGYEIKSAKDSLYRLESQFEVYRQTLQKLTIVTAQKHLDAITNRTPEWCGILEARQGARGGIRLETIRSARTNPDVDPVMMAHLLWKPEVLELLSQLGYLQKDLRLPRKKLYELLCQTLTLREITNSIRHFMVKRQAWRDHLARG